MTPQEIQEIRKSLGITQERFAALLGCTTTSVNRWELGKVKPSRLYIREIKELKSNHATHLHRRKEPEKS